MGIKEKIEFIAAFVSVTGLGLLCGYCALHVVLTGNAGL